MTAWPGSVPPGTGRTGIWKDPAGARKVGRVYRLANTKSAEKRTRSSEKRRLRNKSVMSSLKTAVRKYLEAQRSAAASGSPSDLERTAALLREAESALDRAKAKGIIHPNRASRGKSRLTARLVKISPERQAGKEA